ncbi:MAG: nicotinate-nucleotide adenylyltransferase [Vicinamibacterales bacterium]
MATLTGVLGGTFDPIHLGHLAVARQAADALGLHRVLLLPSRTPPHRPVDPSASLHHRFAMVALAASADARLVASDLEMGRPGPSYTADTLRALGATGLGAWQIFFLTGADAFAEIATWREYPAVLDLAHFVVCSRAGAAATALPARLPDLAPRMIRVLVPGSEDPGLHPQDPGLHGVVVKEGPETRVFLLDCPTPDISSTSIRADARAGRPLAGLVPPEVDDYIRRHRLYGADDGAAHGGRPAAGNLHE